MQKYIISILCSLLLLSGTVYAQTNICNYVNGTMWVSYWDTYRDATCGPPDRPCNSRRTYCPTNATLGGTLGVNGWCAEIAAIENIGTHGLGTCNAYTGQRNNRYSKECAVWEKCMKSTGGQYGMCEAHSWATEQIAVSPDCGNVSGSYKDQWGDWMFLSQEDDSPIITGEREGHCGTESCGTSILDGILADDGTVTLTLSNNPDQPSQCTTATQYILHADPYISALNGVRRDLDGTWRANMINIKKSGVVGLPTWDTSYLTTFNCQ